MRGANRKKVGIQRRLRRDSTDAEMKLWFALRGRRLGGLKFVRQEAVNNFVVDFICREKKLVVEVDGGQHSENLQDRTRDMQLAKDGYLVLRFWNNDVLQNPEGVLQTISEALNSR